MRMRNASDARVKLDALGIDVAPGEVCEIPDGYARPRLASNGCRIAAVVENLAPQLRPDDDQEFAEWLKAPTENPPVPPRPVKIGEGMPPGVAEIMQKAALDNTEKMPVQVQELSKRRGRKLSP